MLHPFGRVRVLTVNGGSSSVRLGAFRVETPGAAPARMLVRRVATVGPDAGDVDDTLALVIDALGGVPDAVIHRLVHGGPRLRHTARLDDGALAELERARPLAPLHLGPQLALVARLRTTLPRVLALAAFDTALYRDLPPEARALPLPAALVAEHGLERYGFHGLAHASMWRGLTQLRPGHARTGRAVTVQLGSGCSVTALEAGSPRWTSMGLTPLGGLVMATRPGDLDPGVVLALARAGLDPAALERLFDEQSGLLGMSGERDVRRLLARDDAPARLALDVFCHRAAESIAAAFVSMAGADAVVFGGGVGEHAPEVRRRIVRLLGFLGFRLDEARNAGAVPPAVVSTCESDLCIVVAAVDEEQLLAEEAVAFLSRERGAS